jgi:hydroxypyruvate isomerase
MQTISDGEIAFDRLKKCHRRAAEFWLLFPEAHKRKAIPMVKRGRIRQSFSHWCFAKHWDVPQSVQVAKRLGLPALDLIEPKYFPLLKKEGLECSLCPIDMSPDVIFVKGYNNPEHHARVIHATKEAVDTCAAYGYPNVVVFTGLRNGIPDDVGAANCVDGFKKVVGYAEQKKVTLCLELLNSRDESGPNMGHPGYQGDHTEYCIDIIRRVGSPALKFLFDIYHVQIMDGDLIRRIRDHKDFIGHVHTAGNPGRGDLDDKQEIQYKSIIEALVATGYTGYVGQEFIPKGDPFESLSQAVTLCDV